MEVARHEVQTVRMMFQELKYQISDDLKCLVSRMRKDFFCCKIAVCDYRPCRFVRIASFSSSVNL